MCVCLHLLICSLYLAVDTSGRGYKSLAYDVKDGYDVRAELCVNCMAHLVTCYNVTVLHYFALHGTMACIIHPGTCKLAVENPMLYMCICYSFMHYMPNVMSNKRQSRNMRIGELRSEE